MKPIIIYASTCRFCRWMASTVLPYIDRQHKFDVLPLQHPVSQHYLNGIPKAEQTRTWWVVWPFGQVYPGDSLGLQIVLHTTGSWTRFIPYKWGVWGEHWISCHRSFLSKWVPDTSETIRYEGEEQ